MGWRFCDAGVKLLDEINTAFPGRDTSSDGIIGDVAHQHEVSDHNPNDYGVVTAWDCTVASWSTEFANALKESNDSRLKYVIWNHHIWSRARNSEGWRLYDGADPHTSHIHISFSALPAQYDRTDGWHLYPKETSDNDMTKEEHDRLINVEKMLIQLTAPRRPDKRDIDPDHLSLADIYTLVETK